MENFKYIMVLLDEVVNGLNICLDGIYIDGIFGCGGYLCLIFL